MSSLRITEIFHSLQGESKTVGMPTVFVRLTGCPLRCQYCDSAYAFSGGELLDIEVILDKVARWNVKYITVTGGEPLAQPSCRELLTRLCDRGYEVSLETSGALSIENIDARVSIVLDLKTPDSGESHRNLYENIPLLKATDQVKFVLCSRQDYDWARLKVDALQLSSYVDDILFSPSINELNATDLADWIVADQLPIRFQMQLHKLLWGDQPGR